MSDEYKRQYDLGKMESEATYIAELLHQYDIPKEYCVHCIVTKYDEKANTVDVQPLPDHTRDMIDTTDIIPRSEVKDIRILSYAHGGFVVSNPVFVGDTGYIIASDRKCRNIMLENSSVLYADDEYGNNNLGHSVPDDLSLTMFENGFFIPCSWADNAIQEEERGCFVIKGIGKNEGDDYWQKLVLSNDGRITLEVSDGGIDVKVGEGVTARSRLNVVGSSRMASINPDEDLADTDAKFREVTVLTGFKEKVGTVAKFFAKKMRVLADNPTDDPLVEVEVGGGSGSLNDVNMASQDGSVTISKTSSEGIISFNVSVVKGKFLKWGTTLLSYFAGTDDVTLPKSALSFVEDGVSTGVNFVADNDMTLYQKKLIEGEGITIVDNPANHTVTISANGSALSPGSAISIVDDTVGCIVDSANTTPLSSTLDVAGSGVGELCLHGVRDIANHSLDTLAATLAGKTHSGSEYAVTVKDGSVFYKLIDALNLVAAANSGLTFTFDSSNNSKKLDWTGRQAATAIALRDVSVTDDTGVVTTVKVPASQNFMVEHLVAGTGLQITGSGPFRTISLTNDSGAVRSIIAGDNVTVSRNGDAVTISSTASGSSSGYSQDIPFISSITYSSHQLVAHKKILKMNNGCITNVVDGSDEIITTAVQETIPT